MHLMASLPGNHVGCVAVAQFFSHIKLEALIVGLIHLFVIRIFFFFFLIATHFVDAVCITLFHIFYCVCIIFTHYFLIKNKPSSFRCVFFPI